MPPRLVLHARRRVESVTSLLSATWFAYVAADDWIEVRDFLEEVPEEAGALALARERALANPMYRRTLVSPDARTTAIEVRLREMSDAELIERDLDGRIEAIVAEHAGVTRFPPR